MPRSLGRRAVESAQWRFSKWVSPLLRTPSRLWYGNDARWVDNRRGADEIARTFIPGTGPLPDDWWRCVESDTTERRERERRARRGLA